jgi:uncharacterized protein (UPF0335 family)
MDIEKRPTDPDLIKSYIERGLAVRSSIKELEMEFRGLMKDAQADGLEQQAYRTLVTLRAAESKQRTEAILNTLVGYSMHAGLELEMFAERSSSKLETSEREQRTDGHASASVMEEKKLIGDASMPFVQAMIGVMAGGLFVWLLH